MKNQETTLQILETDSPNERIAVCLVRCPGSSGTRIRLREESFSSHVGWYTQGHVDLSPQQIQALRSVLGPLASEAVPATRKMTRPGAASAGFDGDEAPATIKLSANRAG